MNEAINNLESFKEVVIEKPSDLIIKQIQTLIETGQLKPGDKLPSERKLSEKIGIGRTYVRDAIKKLEFYGILKTLPQSGTVVSNMGISSISGIISNILKMNGSSFFSLVETRVLLETNSVMLAAERRTKEDLVNIKRALEAYRIKAETNVQAVEEDLIFHIALAEASKNTVLKSLLMVLVPDVISIHTSLNICNTHDFKKNLNEHLSIYKAIEEQKPELAKECMNLHLSDVLLYSKNNLVSI